MFNSALGCDAVLINYLSIYLSRSLVGDYHGELSLLNVDDFSNVNETSIKVLSCYLSGHVDVPCPVDKKKNVSVVKNISL